MYFYKFETSAERSKNLSKFRFNKCRLLPAMRVLHECPATIKKSSFRLIVGAAGLATHSQFRLDSFRTLRTFCYIAHPKLFNFISFLGDSLPLVGDQSQTKPTSEKAYNCLSTIKLAVASLYQYRPIGKPTHLQLQARFDLVVVSPVQHSKLPTS